MHKMDIYDIMKITKTLPEDGLMLDEHCYLMEKYIYENETINSDIDIILSIKCDTLMFCPININFFSKDNADYVFNLCEFKDINHGQYYEFQEILPLFMASSSKVSYQGCSKLLIRYIHIPNHQIKKDCQILKKPIYLIDGEKPIVIFGECFRKYFCG